MVSFGASFYEPHEYPLGRVARFLPEAGDEAFPVAHEDDDDAGEVRLDVGNHPQLTRLLADFLPVALRCDP